MSLARILVAAPASGHGKTTLATGLMAALRRRGLAVSGHKVGPDYIDPGYHALATGRPGRNLDPHLTGESLVVPLLLHGARGADIAVLEGVMGLFDGRLGGAGFASTAHVATLTRTPVLLVVDISHASRSIGAVVHGMATFQPGLTVAGVVLNKAGSARHAAEAAQAVAAAGVPVVGVLHRDAGVSAPSRHLGLVPAAERDEAATALERLAEQVDTHVDVDAILELATTAPELDSSPWDPTVHVKPAASGSPVVAVAGGRVFTFRYAETTELLEAAGCTVVPFDPAHDPHLPAGTRGLYLGGGFPEVHAATLAANTSLRAELRQAVLDGVPTVAECAGLLYLCRSVDGNPMVGALDADAVMTSRLTLAYRRAVFSGNQLLGDEATPVTAHEFHRTTVTPGHGDSPAWTVDGTSVGFASQTLSASYLHVQWAGHPGLAQRFADAAHAADTHRATSPPPDVPARPASGAAPDPAVPNLATPDPAVPSLAAPDPAVANLATPDPAVPNLAAPDPALADPLRHHGDVEVTAGLLDFAVNVSRLPRPDWLEKALAAGLAASTSYPDTRAAHHALARRYGRDSDEVLVTAGAAEAFVLLARARAWRHPVVVHPQFTEPDVALRTAGHVVHHVMCRPDDGFALDPARVPGDADLVVVGNPTNPTGRLHPARHVRALVRPGRVVAVDEAFMDFVPGEPETLAAHRLPGLVVLRSLTKIWSIPGVRAGFVLGDAAVVAELRQQQPPWSVSTPALAAAVATTEAAATAEQEHRVHRTAHQRQVLIDGLTELGIAVVDSQAPFVLARLGAGAHARLRAAGVAVRRADTFPGLDGTWARIAVRAPAATRHLLTTLRTTTRWN